MYNNIRSPGHRRDHQFGSNRRRERGPHHSWVRSMKYLLVSKTREKVGLLPIVSLPQHILVICGVDPGTTKAKTKTRKR